MTGTDWRKPLDEAAARIKDPAARAELASLMERAVEIGLQVAGGAPGAARDMAVVTASIAHLAAEQVQVTIAAVEAAAAAKLRQVIWTTLFGLAVP